VTDLLRAESHEWARDEAIRAFLRSRPEFVRGDPELMQALGVRPDAANVIDFGPEALSRAAKAHKRESRERRRIEAVARANFDGQSKTHDAALHLLGATGHADLAARLDDQLDDRIAEIKLKTQAGELDWAEAAIARSLCLEEHLARISELRRQFFGDEVQPCQ